MESAEYSLDELLCQSLLLFRQYRFYDAPECGEKAFRILEEAHVWMGRTQECVDMAKWGCVIECLAQKYYIEDDTDAILEEIDAALVAHWKRIEKIHAEYTSVIQYNNENSLSSVLSIAYLSAIKYYFKPIREFSTGRGFADFVFIPKPEYKNDYPALLVELKWNQNAQTALTQIKTKKYPSSILNYTGDILLVGINYDKKSKEHQCLIEKYVKGENRGTGVV